MMLLDVEKAYENFTHKDMIAQADKWGFKGEAQRAARFYQSGRVLSWQDMETEVMRVRATILAGCSQAVYW
eukprot:5152379-Amphidinium_carterae.1